MKNLIKKILRESDGLDWIREVPNIYDLIQPSTAYFCEHCSHKQFMGLLKLIEKKYPETRWSGGQKPTKYYTPLMITIYFNDELILSYGTSLKPNPTKYSLIHIDSYRTLLQSI